MIQFRSPDIFKSDILIRTVSATKTFSFNHN